MSVGSVFLLTFMLAPSVLLAQDGAALYRRYCASCHESGAQTRAPSRDALRQLTPERIMHALESIASPMSTQGMARSSAERRALALYLSDKPFGRETPIDYERIACKQPARFIDPFSGPSWNGWSTGLFNRRFQSAAAAGLDAASVPQLKLKWAFGYPGDIMAYSQPTVVGGRVFVGSEGGHIYSLDASTGCLYWRYRADTGVRAAISVGPRKSSTTYAVYFGDLSANMYALDATSGTLLWKTNVDRHRAARITGAPALHAGKLYAATLFDGLIRLRRAG